MSNCRTSAVAWWTYTIAIVSCGRRNGLKIVVKKDFGVSDEPGFSGDYDIVHPCVKDAKTMLSEKMTSLLLVEEKTIERLRASFCGVWPLFYSGACGYTLCNPCFTEQGDFIFELESPLDCYGQVVVSGRKDICLPAKHHGTS
jgi:hypothetical protein